MSEKNDQNQQPEDNKKEIKFEELGFQDSAKNKNLSSGDIKSTKTRKQTVRRRGR